MGSICLSSASILRCDPLTRNQNIYLIIPTALEVIFSTSLVFIDQGPAKWVAQVHVLNILLTCLQTKSTPYGGRIIFPNTCAYWAILKYSPCRAGESSFIRSIWLGNRWVESAFFFFLHPYSTFNHIQALLPFYPFFCTPSFFIFWCSRKPSAQSHAALGISSDWPRSFSY